MGVSEMMAAVRNSGGTVECQYCGAPVPVSTLVCPYCSRVQEKLKVGSEEEPTMSTVLKAVRSMAKYDALKSKEDWMFIKPSGIQNTYINIYRYLVQIGSEMANKAYGAEIMSDEEIGYAAEYSMLLALSEYSKASAQAMDYIDGLEEVIGVSPSCFIMHSNNDSPVHLGFHLSLGDSNSRVSVMTSDMFERICTLIEALLIDIADAVQLMKLPAEKCLDDVYIKDPKHTVYMMIAEVYAPLFKRKHVRRFQDPQAVYQCLTAQSTVNGFIGSMEDYMNYLFDLNSFFNGKAVSNIELVQPLCQLICAVAYETLKTMFPDSVNMMLSGDLVEGCQSLISQGLTPKVFDVFDIQGDYMH